MKSRHALAAFLLLLLLGAGILFFEKPFSSPPAGRETLFGSFDTDLVRTIRLSFHDQGIKLFKDGKEWRLSSLTNETEEDSQNPRQPELASLSFPADPEAVERMLAAVAGLRSSGAVSASPDKYPTFHVDSSGTLVELQGPAGNLSFILGKAGTGGNTYLRKVSPPPDPQVYLVPEEMRSIFLKSIYDLRQKKVIDLDVSTLQEIRLKHGSETITFRRDPIKKWVWEGKESSTLDYEAVESLARNLSHVKAISLEGSISAKESGLESPEAIVSLKFSGSPVELQLKLGKLKEADTYFAALTGSKAWEGEVFTVPQVLAEKLKASSNQFLFHPEP